MTATTPVAFDPAPEILKGGWPHAIAGAAILKGQIIGFAATGVSRTLHPSTSSLGSPVGIALASQATVGGPVSFAGEGSVLTVMLSADDGAADAGDWVGVSTVAGCAIVQDGAIAAHTTEGVGLFPIGQCIEDSVVGGATVGSTVKIRVDFSPVWTAVS
jgi:hypothetical protein